MCRRVDGRGAGWGARKREFVNVWAFSWRVWFSSQDPISFLALEWYDCGTEACGSPSRARDLRWLV
jgi:hypothetical protein